MFVLVGYYWLVVAMEKQKEGVGEEEAAKIAAHAKTGKEGEMHKQLADFKDALQRLQAEFENYKKRVDKEKLQVKQFAVAEFVKSLLPVLDSFELALKAIGNSSDAKLVKGMEMIYAQFYSVLESQGLRPIRALGDRLDPYKHEVLMQEGTHENSKDGLIAEEFQRGYVFGDIVLRYSKVKVLHFVKKDANDSK